MKIIPFEPHHASLLIAQPGQRREVDAHALSAPTGEAWTAVVDGLPVACAGLIEMWSGRAYAWALMGSDSGRHMLSITRAIRFRLATTDFARVELVVDASFAAGSRWALMLGFELETPKPLRHYLPGGRAAWLYSRVKHGSSSDRRRRTEGNLDLRGIAV